MWGMHKAGVPVNVTYWDENATKPDFVLVSPKPNVQQQCIDLERPDLLTMTVGDVCLELHAGMKLMESHPVISQYWNEGTSERVESSLNTPTEFRVQATRVTLPGTEQQLLHVYTPCDLVDPVPVGDLLLPLEGDHEAYFITSPPWSRIR